MIVACNMQYVGQTCRFLKTRYTEHCRQMKNPRKIDTFLYGLIILLVVFVFSLLKYFMIQILLRDIGIFAGRN